MSDGDRFNDDAKYSSPVVSVFDDDSNEDPFSKLEKLILLHSSTTKRGRTINSSPDTLFSDTSDGIPTKRQRPVRELAPPVITFGPIPNAKDAAKFQGSSSAKVMATIYLFLNQN